MADISSNITDNHPHQLGLWPLKQDPPPCRRLISPRKWASPTRCVCYNAWSPSLRFLPAPNLCHFFFNCFSSDLISVRLWTPICTIPSDPNFWTLAYFESIPNWMSCPWSGHLMGCRLSHSPWQLQNYTHPPSIVPPLCWEGTQSLPQIQVH